MKEILDQIENHLKNSIENKSVDLFGLENGEEKIISSLIVALVRKMKIDPEGFPSAPNIIILSIPSQHTHEIHENRELLDNLANELMAAGAKFGVRFSFPVSINIFPNENLKEGEFHLRALRNTGALPPLDEAARSKSTPAPKQETEPESTSNPSNYFLIVGGAKIFPLTDETTNIGRKPANQVVIDDPRISRVHCQIKIKNNKVMILDQSSSGGTFVNGERVTESPLNPGDVISLAGIPIIYGQDAVNPISKSSKYHSPDQPSLSTTNITNIKPIDLDTFTD